MLSQIRRISDAHLNSVHISNKAAKFILEKELKHIDACSDVQKHVHRKEEQEILHTLKKLKTKKSSGGKIRLKAGKNSNSKSSPSPKSPAQTPGVSMHDFGTSTYSTSDLKNAVQDLVQHPQLPSVLITSDEEQTQIRTEVQTFPPELKSAKDTLAINDGSGNTFVPVLTPGVDGVIFAVSRCVSPNLSAESSVGDLLVHGEYDPLHRSKGMIELCTDCQRPRSPHPHLHIHGHHCSCEKATRERKRSNRERRTSEEELDRGGLRVSRSRRRSLNSDYDASYFRDISSHRRHSLQKTPARKSHPSQPTHIPHPPKSSTPRQHDDSFAHGRTGERYIRGRSTSHILLSPQATQRPRRHSLGNTEEWPPWGGRFELPFTRYEKRRSIDIDDQDLTTYTKTHRHSDTPVFHGLIHPDNVINYDRRLSGSAVSTERRSSHPRGYSVHTHQSLKSGTRHEVEYNIHHPNNILLYRLRELLHDPVYRNSQKEERHYPWPPAPTNPLTPEEFQELRNCRYLRFSKLNEKSFEEYDKAHPRERRSSYDVVTTNQFMK